MATRRRRKTTTRKRKGTKKGMVRKTARRAYMSKKNAPKRRRRRAKKNPPMQPLLYAAAGGAAAGLVERYVAPNLPGGPMVQQYGGPALQIALGAFLSTSKNTKQFKDVGLGMVAVAASGLVSKLMAGPGMSPITASSGWMPASVVEQRYLNPPASSIPLNSFLADIVVP